MVVEERGYITRAEYVKVLSDSGVSEEAIDQDSFN
jgi:hypothetical protein